MALEQNIAVNPNFSLLSMTWPLPLIANHKLIWSSWTFPKPLIPSPHNRLLLKLDRYGIRGNLLAWISNFLKCRAQRVVVSGEHSDWTDVVFGVPQGTVLGPLLFLAYINDLPHNLNSEVRLFADDCVIYRQIQNDLDHTLLQDDLITLEKWQNDWQMSFNVKKCFIMRINMSEIQKFSTSINSANAYWKKQIITHTLASTSQTTYPGLHISVIIISLHLG